MQVCVCFHKFHDCVCMHDCVVCVCMYVCACMSCVTMCSCIIKCAQVCMCICVGRSLVRLKILPASVLRSQTCTTLLCFLMFWESNSGTCVCISDMLLNDPSPQVQKALKKHCFRMYVCWIGCFILFCHFDTNSSHLERSFI